jgi:hypothetical protein
MLAPPLNKTAPFHVKKKKVQNSVVLNDTVPLSPSPGRAAGEGNFFLLSSLNPTRHLPAKAAPHALS